MQKPAIVVPCYNRTTSLDRLLNSLIKADYPADGGVTLIISVDYSGKTDVADMADAFQWPHGDKIVLKHKENLGLKKNLLLCSDYSIEYTSAIILEEDSYVTPAFYRFACESALAYADDPVVAGVSLYAYCFTELSCVRFMPLRMDSPVYLSRWPSSRGQLWIGARWKEFRNWLDKQGDASLTNPALPPPIARWSSSWKKYMVAYLTLNDKYMVYPYQSYSTNCGDTGCHTIEGSYPDVQVPVTLDMHVPSFPPSDKIAVRYDAFFNPTEDMLKALQPELAGYAFDVDMWATKPDCALHSEYLLSTRKCRNSIYSYDWKLLPIELNVITSLRGERIHFAKRDDFAMVPDKEVIVRNLLWSNKLLTPRDMITIVCQHVVNKVKCIFR
ncbi:MAG: glycosyltransferase family 2 protein [Opitutales bacterium]|nr:glycosyltransferase family 2 protein [Opitutales bacterium]